MQDAVANVTAQIAPATGEFSIMVSLGNYTRSQVTADANSISVSFISTPFSGLRSTETYTVDTTGRISVSHHKETQADYGSSEMVVEDFVYNRGTAKYNRALDTVISWTDTAQDASVGMSDVDGDFASIFGRLYVLRGAASDGEFSITVPGGLWTRFRLTSNDRFVSMATVARPFSGLDRTEIVTVDTGEAGLVSHYKEAQADYGSDEMIAEHFVYAEGTEGYNRLVGGVISGIGTMEDADAGASGAEAQFDVISDRLHALISTPAEGVVVVKTVDPDSGTVTHTIDAINRTVVLSNTDGDREVEWGIVNTQSGATLAQGELSSIFDTVDSETRVLVSHDGSSVVVASVYNPGMNYSADSTTMIIVSTSDGSVVADLTGTDAASRSFYRTYLNNDGTALVAVGGGTHNRLGDEPGSITLTLLATGETLQQIGISNTFSDVSFNQDSNTLEVAYSAADWSGYGERYVTTYSVASNGIQVIDRDSTYATIAETALKALLNISLMPTSFVGRTPILDADGTKIGENIELTTLNLEDRNYYNYTVALDMNNQVIGVTPGSEMMQPTVPLLKNHYGFAKSQGSTELIINGNAYELTNANEPDTSRGITNAGLFEEGIVLQEDGTFLVTVFYGAEHPYYDIFSGRYAGYQFDPREGALTYLGRLTDGISIPKDAPLETRQELILAGLENAVTEASAMIAPELTPIQLAEATPDSIRYTLGEYEFFVEKSPVQGDGGAWVVISVKDTATGNVLGLGHPEQISNGRVSLDTPLDEAVDVQINEGGTRAVITFQDRYGNTRSSLISIESGRVVDRIVGGSTLSRGVSQVYLDGGFVITVHEGSPAPYPDGYYVRDIRSSISVFSASDGSVVASEDVAPIATGVTYDAETGRVTVESPMDPNEKDGLTSLDALTLINLRMAHGNRDVTPNDEGFTTSKDPDGDLLVTVRDIETVVDTINAGEGGTSVTHYVVEDDGSLRLARGEPILTPVQHVESNILRQQFNLGRDRWLLIERDSYGWLVVSVINTEPGKHEVIGEPQRLGHSQPMPNTPVNLYTDVQISEDGTRALVSFHTSHDRTGTADTWLIDTTNGEMLSHISDSRMTSGATRNTWETAFLDGEHVVVVNRGAADGPYLSQSFITTWSSVNGELITRTPVGEEVVGATYDPATHTVTAKTPLDPNGKDGVTPLDLLGMITFGRTHGWYVDSPDLLRQYAGFDRNGNNAIELTDLLGVIDVLNGHGEAVALRHYTVNAADGSVDPTGIAATLAAEAEAESAAVPIEERLQVLDDAVRAEILPEDDFDAVAAAVTAWYASRVTAASAGIQATATARRISGSSDTLAFMRDEIHADHMEEERLKRMVDGIPEGGKVIVWDKLIPTEKGYRRKLRQLAKEKGSDIAIVSLEDAYNMAIDPENGENSVILMTAALEEEILKKHGAFKEECKTSKVRKIDLQNYNINENGFVSLEGAIALGRAIISKSKEDVNRFHWRLTGQHLADAEIEAVIAGEKSLAVLLPNITGVSAEEFKQLREEAFALLKFA